MYTDQIHEGEDYSVLKKCIHVGILNFTLQQGIQQGIQQGRLQTLKELLESGLISIAEVASILQTSEQKAEEMIK